MKNFLIYTLVSLTASLICGFFAVPALRRIKAGQPVLKYVETHKDKNGTPTMGGLFFIIPSSVVFLLSGGSNRLAVVAVTIGLAFMAVGFIDDFLKIKRKTNEGLKPYQKMLFLCVIALFAGIFAYVNGLTVFYLPFTVKVFDAGWFTVPLVAVVFIAMTNSVNLTDGLDGLAASVSFTYLVFLIALICAEKNVFGYIYLKPEEYDGLCGYAASIAGGLLAFLFFNSSKASVFIGDTGSLSLGGILGAVSVFSSNGLFIPVLGLPFVTSSLSVIIQVLHFKRTGKRVFLMAPLHHHFQMKGYSETKISFAYSLVTGILGALSVICYIRG